jgi:oxygen-independent coproporphyrinogen-3 oxidase
MSTLYLHIPFCKQACHYCDFHFSTVKKTYQPVMAAMLRELDLRADYLPSKQLSSVYFGGGTPSLLENDDLLRLMEQTNTLFTLAADAEITLEANPDDLTKTALKNFRQAGINRLSIGTQSFFDADLVVMNRAHNASEAESSIKRAQDAGFENLTIDLIYGMPDADFARWRANVQKAIELHIPHLSAYALTVEPKTALAKKVALGEISIASEIAVEQQYLYLCEALKQEGFAHYELSNFGKPNFESRHNTSYWDGTPYLGIGPSAHSFDGKTRQFNVANNSLYAAKVGSQTPWFDEEEIGENDQFNEYVMTGLRTAKGISLTEIDTRFGEFRTERLLRDAANYLECGRLKQTDDRLYIPERDWLISDRIISDLFWVA